MLIPNLVKYGTAVFAASKFKALDYFTQYDDADSVTTELSNFGLKSEYTWDGLLSNLSNLNSQSDAKYKIIFLARHGEAWHNVLKSRDDYDEIATKDTFENYTLFDDDLTPEGETEVENTRDYWGKELKANEGLPYPEIFYTSPLRRTLHTFHITWDNNSIVPVVDENLRERYGLYKPYKRHNKTWIQDYCPTCTFTSGFTEDDELWEADKREKKKHVKKRTEKWLKTVFETDELVVSVTSHSGTIEQLLKAIDHPAHDLGTAQVLPVVIKATN